MSQNESKYYEKIFPLISAWGTAIEQRRDSTNELNALKTAYQEDPARLQIAIKCAETFQNSQVGKKTSQHDDDLSHPRQRLARVQHLKNLLKIP